MTYRKLKRLGWFTYWAVLLVLGICAISGVGKTAESPRIAFRVHGTWTLEVAASNPVNGLIWRVESSGPLDGGAFIQAQAASSAVSKGCEARRDGSGVCKRLTIAIDKPIDKLATLKIQFPARTAGITAPVGASQAVLRLSELSLDDYGLASLQLTVEGATNAVYGVFNLNTFEVEVAPASQPAATIDGTPAESASQVKAGWHFLWFGPGKELDVNEDPSELLSLCGFYPSGKHECTDAHELKLWVRERGNYFFVAWDKHLESAVYSIQGI